MGAALNLGLVLLGAPVAGADTPVRLPTVRVEEDMDHWQFSLPEIVRVTAELEHATAALRAVGIQIRRTRDSRCEIPPRLILRDKTGHPSPGEQPTGDFLPMDRWPADGFVSSNQPREFANIYLVVATQSLPGDLRAAVLRDLLAGYNQFVDGQVQGAVRYYGARDVHEFADAERLIRPDALAILATDADAARRIGARLQVAPAGPRLVVPYGTLERLAKADPGCLIALAGEVQALAPWRTAERNPPDFDHGGVLLMFGWFSYRPSLLSAPRQERVILGLTIL